MTSPTKTATRGRSAMDARALIDGVARFNLEFRSALDARIAEPMTAITPLLTG